jgi:hypothetical protein
MVCTPVAVRFYAPLVLTSAFRRVRNSESGQKRAPTTLWRDGCAVSADWSCALPRFEERRPMIFSTAAANYMIWLG